MDVNLICGELVRANQKEKRPEMRPWIKVIIIMCSGVAFVAKAEICATGEPRQTGIVRQASEKRTKTQEEERVERLRKQKEERLAKEREIAEQRNMQHAQEFFNCRSRMGGSVLEPLVSRLNDINEDAMSHATPRMARELAMSKIEGSIGPVNYHRIIRTKTITSTQSIGTIQGYSPTTGFVTGDIYAPVSSTKTKVGNYVCDVPNGFKAALDEMSRIGRKGHARAKAEVAACIFVDATKGMIGMDDRKALKLFESAANSGEAEAMFMQAFCLFYGIGVTKKDVSKAYRVLLDWEKCADSQSLRNSGWAKRRLSEAHEMIQN
jgi:hypothetical protein